MRIELPKSVERVGAICLGELQRVFELDSGMECTGATPGTAIQQVSYPELCEIYEQMAVVVPVRSERLRLIEGVLCGIPHPCLVLIVSNSPRTPIDRFTMEEEALRDVCRFVGKDALIVHQKDPSIGRAFRRAGYPHLLDESGEVLDGKAEGMLVATQLVWLAGKKYIGFVDADNYFPGAVEEYVREYAAGFALGRSPYSMVRIAWHSKPKVVESKLFFRKWGRTSADTNRLLNKLLSHYTGFETEIIKTGNAGEHAMTMELARKLEYSSGYSIEPHHFLSLLEKFGGISTSPHPEAMEDKIEVYQIESRNPHLHEAGDEAHIDEMRFQAMQVIYHSAVCPDALREELRREMAENGFLREGEEPPRPRGFPPLSSIDDATFLEEIEGAPYADAIRTAAELAGR